MAFVRLSPAEFTSAGRAAILERFERVERARAEGERDALVPSPRRKAAEPAIEADLEWDEQRPA